MPTPHSCLRAIAATLPAVMTSSLALLAQVPEGHALVSTVTENNAPGTPGLFVVPLTGGPAVPITGLPAELSTPGSLLEGAFSISIRPSDGAIFATTVSEPGSISNGSAKLWELHLNGLAVDPARTRQVTLGTVTNGFALANHALLPSGLVVVHAVNGLGGPNVIPLPAGPMANRRFALVSTATTPATVAVLPNPPGIAGQGFATLAADPTGGFLYYTLSADVHNVPTDASLMRYDLTTRVECQIANWPGETAFGVFCDDDGTVYVSSTNPTTVEHFIHSVEPNGCSQATVTSVLSSAPLLALGVALDRASGRFVASSLYNRPGFSGSQLNRLSAIDAATGEVTLLSQTPSGGWGTMIDVTVNNFMDGFGARSDGSNRYWFDNFPNPTDYPFVGNSAFALQIESSPGTATASALSLSFARGLTNVAGIEYLLDPATAVTTLINATAPYPIPIPNDTSFAGVAINAQSLHLESNLLAASRGLEFTITTLPAPTIRSVTPPVAQPGVSVTIDGADFYSGLELRVAGNTTPIVSQTRESLTFVMPAGVTCDSAVTLTNLGGAVTSTTINATPGIVFSTSTGPAAGGQLFVLTGQNLFGATVTIGGAPLASIVSQSATAIVGNTPPGTPGAATVVVTGPTGCQDTTTYTYQ